MEMAMPLAANSLLHCRWGGTTTWFVSRSTRPCYALIGEWYMQIWTCVCSVVASVLCVSKRVEEGRCYCCIVSTLVVPNVCPRIYMS